MRACSTNNNKGVPRRRHIALVCLLARSLARLDHLRLAARAVRPCLVMHHTLASPLLALVATSCLLSSVSAGRDFRFWLFGNADKTCWDCCVDSSKGQPLVKACERSLDSLEAVR